MDDTDMMNYRLFEFWWKNNRNDDPRTAITESLARNIAILVYDSLNY